MRSDAAYPPSGKQPRDEAGKKACDDAYWQNTGTESESSSDYFDEEEEIMVMSAQPDTEHCYSGPHSMYSKLKESPSGTIEEPEDKIKLPDPMSERKPPKLSCGDHNFHGCT